MNTFPGHLGAGLLAGLALLGAGGPATAAVAPALGAAPFGRQRDDDRDGRTSPGRKDGSRK